MLAVGKRKRSPRYERFHAPRAGGAPEWLPQIPVVIFHRITLQERDVFFLKCLFPVMLDLVVNVLRHGFNLGRADGESAVAILPRELPYTNRSMNPFRRCMFDIPENICQTMSSSNAN